MKEKKGNDEFKLDKDLILEESSFCSFSLSSICSCFSATIDKASFRASQRNLKSRASKLTNRMNICFVYNYCMQGSHFVFINF